MVGADFCHVEQRRDQAVGDAAVVGAFADGVDARVIGLHGVADNDAAAAVQAGFFGQFGIGTDTDGDDHQFGGDGFTALQPD